MAQDTGTQAVIKSAHFDRLTPRVSRFGLVRALHHRTVLMNVIKKNMIKDMKKNHNQCWYCNICKNQTSSCTKEGDATKGSG